MELDDGRMSLMEHLTELRDRIIKIVIAVVVGMVMAFVLYDPIFDFLIQPYEELAKARDLGSTTATSCSPPTRSRASAIRMKTVALRRDRPRHAGDPVADLAVRHPRPLPAREALRDPVRASARSRCSCSAPASPTTRCRRRSSSSSTSADDNFVDAYSPAKYFKLITYMMLAFGIGFEFPILLVFLQMAGSSTPRQLAGVPPLRHRRHLRARRRDHAVGRPDQHADAVGADGASSTRSSILIGRIMERRRSRPHRPDGARAPAYDFALDPFQQRAIAALDDGQSVLVAAPTGAGRRWWPSTPWPRRSPRATRPSTRRRSRRCRTRSTPTSAAATAPSGSGLLTGDNAINGDAPVVVMTTEVLRNMIYAGSPALRGLRYVVLDEVHYLQDAYRGPVWEEVIIHLPHDVALVCLSATVSNAEELADWITTVRGPTEAVIEERRPVELHNLYLRRRQEQPGPAPAADAGRRPPQPRGEPPRRRGAPRARRAVAGPTPPALLHAAAGRGDRPAPGRGDAPGDHFIFSRNACDDARDACLDAGLRLTTPDERARIRAIVDERTATLADADLDVLGYDRFLAGLEMGVAAHHAGMVPPFKEAVEACFTEGLVKAVFATETLALGINMPARSVVIERLTKFTGERHELLTPGEYTQLTGRAGPARASTRSATPSCSGRRSCPSSRWRRWRRAAPTRCARRSGPPTTWRPTWCAATSPTRPTTCSTCPSPSSRPTGPSCGSRPGSSASTRRLARLREEARCERGDVEEYRAAAGGRAAVASGRPRHRRARGGRSHVRGAEPADARATSLVLDGTKVAVLSVAFRKGNPRLHVVDERSKPRSIGADELSEPPHAVGTRRAARAVQPQQPGLPAPGGRGAAPGADQPPRRRRSTTTRRRSTTSFVAAEAHPVADCPDREAHVRSAVQAERVARELDDLDRQVQGRTGSLARRFDRVLRLLEAGATSTAGRSRRRRGAGPHLPRVRPAGRRGHDHRAARRPRRPSLAGLVSCFTYEHRGRDRPPDPWFPSSTVRTRFIELRRIADDLAADEETAGLPATRPPDPASCTSPTPGRPATAWRRCSRTRSCRAATSSGT